MALAFGANLALDEAVERSRHCVGRGKVYEQFCLERGVVANWTGLQVCADVGLAVR
jgi:hypothetical protein